ncbi:hypothetical protein [Halanaerobium sp. MA284_MarDTE_T2]|nr:hypothetical protein [Halanaerobium sp. MA284_MarDTE_T2]RCW44100.1 hypothetical protein DFR78_1211 [Halanaerobium sp. MA284_MarDTE_T2]
MEKKKIKIIKDGPYLVRGNIPLKEEIIIPVDIDPPRGKPTRIPAS